MNIIRRRLDSANSGDSQPAHHFRPGEIVRVTDGPLQGMQAIFEGPSTANERVRVLLDFLGHVRQAHISVADLEKAQPKAEERNLKRPRRTRGRGRRIRSTIL